MSDLQPGSPVGPRLFDSSHKSLLDGFTRETTMNKTQFHKMSLRGVNSRRA